MIFPYNLISFLGEYEAMYQEASADVSKYLANPVNAYLLVKRLTTDWKKVEKVISRNAGSGMFDPPVSVSHIR
jgi:prolyl 4-hydroxylase